MRHVRREHKKVLGSRGGSDEINVPASATDVLRSLLGALPPEVRYRMVDLDIQNGECSFTVRVLDSVDIGKIARALESAGFAVAPPATLQMDPSRDEPVATYESSIKATWQGNESESQKGRS